MVSLFFSSLYHSSVSVILGKEYNKERDHVKFPFYYGWLLVLVLEHLYLVIVTTSSNSMAQVDILITHNKSLTFYLYLILCLLVTFFLGI